MISLKGKDILDGAQFTWEELERIMDVADEFAPVSGRPLALDLLSGYVLATLFFEPSTQDPPLL